MGKPRGRLAGGSAVRVGHQLCLPGGSGRKEIEVAGEALSFSEADEPAGLGDPGGFDVGELLLSLDAGGQASVGGSGSDEGDGWGRQEAGGVVARVANRLVLDGADGESGRDRSDGDVGGRELVVCGRGDLAVEESLFGGGEGLAGERLGLGSWFGALVGFFLEAAEAGPGPGYVSARILGVFADGGGEAMRRDVVEKAEGEQV